MKLLQRLDQEIVDRKPDRSAPIRIASKQTGAGLRRFVVHAMFMAHDRDDIGMIFVIARESPNAVGRQKFLFVQQVPQDGFQPIATHEGKKSPHTSVVGLRFQMLRKVRSVFDEPLHAVFEPRQAVHEFGIKRLHRKQRNKPHHRTDLHVRRGSVRQMQYVVEEAVFAIPQLDFLAADVVHGPTDIDEMFKEFAGHIFVGPIVSGELQRNRQHVEAVHAHPTGGIRLFNVAAGRQRRTPVEHPDVVEAEKPPLEDVLSIGVFTIHPPGKVQQQLVKDAL